MHILLAKYTFMKIVKLWRIFYCWNIPKIFRNESINNSCNIFQLTFYNVIVWNINIKTKP